MPDPKRYKTAKARLYPKGEVELTKIDSLRRAGYDKAIGQPMKGTDQYGPEASDKIKKLLKGGR